MGKAWVRYVPNVSILGISLNPGEFTIKEHVIIVAMSNVGLGSAYAVGTD
jgi:OPT oligopeptide transporter protein